MRALIDLGIAEELGWKVVQIGQLAIKEKIPVKFLEQILVQLKTAGILDSKRGKFGGYFLKKLTTEISFGEVFRLIDGPLAPIPCASITAYQRCTCPDEAHCGLRMLMIDVRNAISQVMDRYTIADVVKITLGKMKQDNVTFSFTAPLPERYLDGITTILGGDSTASKANLER